MGLNVSVKKRQDICGTIFYVLYAFQFLLLLSLIFNVIKVQHPWYGYVLGALSVLGYVFFKLLSSTSCTDVFSVYMIGESAFFAIGVPFLLSLDLVSLQENAVIFYIGVAFNVCSLYIWSILFKNCKFDSKTRTWLYLLPIPYVLNILNYGGFLESFSQIHSMAAIAVNTWIYQYVSLPLSLLIPYGYWKLAHSRYFSSDDSLVTDRLNLNPINIYFGIYLAIAVIFLIPV